LVLGQPLAEDLALVDAEAGGGKLPLHQIGDGHRAVADEMAHLIDAEHRQQHQQCGGATQQQPPVQHPGMAGTDQRLAVNGTEGNGKLAGIDWLGDGKSFGSYLLQLASSTIQLTSSSKEWPAWRACSGTSDVSVMPGWVLSSRQTSSPSTPAASLKRKSARVTPRHPSAACAFRLIFCTLS